MEELEELISSLEEYKMNVSKDLKSGRGIDYNNYRIEKKFSKIVLEREEALELTSILYETIDQGYFSCNLTVKPEKESIGLDFLIQSLPWDQIIDKVPWDSIKDVAGDALKQIIVQSSIAVLKKGAKKLWAWVKGKKQ